MIKENRLIGYLTASVLDPNAPKSSTLQTSTSTTTPGQVIKQPIPVLTDRNASNAPVITPGMTPSSVQGAPTNGMTADQLKVQAAKEYKETGSISPETTAYLKTAGIDHYDPTVTPDQGTDSQTGAYGQTTAPQNPFSHTEGAYSNAISKNIANFQSQLAALPAQRDAAIAAAKAAGSDGYAVSQRFAKQEETLKANLESALNEQKGNQKQAAQEQSDLNKNQQTATTTSTGSSAPETTPTNTEGGGTQAAGGASITPPATHPAIIAASAALNDAMTTLKGMSPEIYNAYLPGLLARQNQLNTLQTQYGDLSTKDFSLDPTVVAAQGAANNVRTTEEANKKAAQDAADTALQLQLDTAKDTHEAALLDQKIIEQKQSEDEHAQMAKNMSEEAAKRRDLIRKGVADDSNGLTALSNAVQAGLDKLASLRQADSLEVLKANLQNGKLYTDSINKIINDYETARAERDAKSLTAETTADNIVTTTTGNAEKDAKTQMKTLVADIGKLEIEAADKVVDARKELDLNTQKDATLAETKQNHLDMMQARFDSLQQQRIAHRDALDAHKDAVALAAANKDIQESETWYTKGRAAAAKMVGDIGSATSSPNISTYNDFNVLYQKFKVASGNGTLNNLNETTSVLMQDLVANANNPKLTARMPSQTLDIMGKNRSVEEYVTGLFNQLKNNGNLPENVLKNMITVMDGMHESSVSFAQDETAGYIISAIHQNSLIPSQYRGNGIDYTDLTQALPVEIVNGAFKALNDNGAGIKDNSLGDVSIGDTAAPPDDASIYNGSSTDSQTGSQKKMSTDSSENGNVDVSNTPLSGYVSSNGFKVTQGFDGMYDKNAGLMSGEHGAFDLAPSVAGTTPPIPAFTPGKVIEVGSSGPYGNHIKIDAGNGITFLYGHLSKVDVKQGEDITSGQQIGVMGSTGELKNGKKTSTGTHLHLQAFKDGKPYNFAEANRSIALNQPSNQS